MQLIKPIPAMQAFCRRAREEGKTLGLVPTMGALHEGHLSLVRHSKRQCDVTVVSIFVNPAQFAQGEDLDRYPRDLPRDMDLLRPYNIDALFAPEAEEMYPPGFDTWVGSGEAADVLEGASRPRHFRGVATAVLKLFNITDPAFGYFGQKDLQQTVVIRRLAQDLNLRTRLVVCPIIRDSDGVAVSSRNAYLSSEERVAARLLSRSLQRAKELVWSGETGAACLAEAMRQVLAADSKVLVDYAALMDAASFRPVERVMAGCVALVAARVGGTRLIDNALLGPPEAGEEQLLAAVQQGKGAIAGPVHAPGFEVESVRRQIEACRDCAAVTSVVLPPREFLAKYLKIDYPDLAAVRVLVIGRDAPWNGESYLYRNPGARDAFTERLLNLVGAASLADFKSRFAMTDAMRCHAIVTPLPERALDHCSRHLAAELKLFPSLRSIVVMGEDAYTQFQRSILGRGHNQSPAFDQLLAEKGWAAEEVSLGALPGRKLNVIYCYHPAGGYRHSPSVAHLLL